MSAPPWTLLALGIHIGPMGVSQKKGVSGGRSLPRLAGVPGGGTAPWNAGCAGWLAEVVWLTPFWLKPFLTEVVWLKPFWLKPF